MSLTLGALLIPYGLFLVLFVAFAFMDIYHMVKFGTYTFANYIALFCFLAGTMLVLWSTWALVREVQWSLSFLDVGGDVLSGNTSIGL